MEIATSKQRSTGHYFKSQIPAQCGHYYPDVIRVRDESRAGKFVRILDCCLCGRYEIQISKTNFQPDQSIRDSEIPPYRECEMRRILKRAKRSH